MSLKTDNREHGDEDEILFIQPRCYCKDFSNSQCKVPTFCNGPPKDNFAFCESCSCFCVYDVKISQQCRCHRKKSTVSKEFCQTGSHRPSVNLTDGGMLKSLCFPCLTKKCKVYRFKGSSILGSPSSPTTTYDADSLPPSPVSPGFSPGTSPIWPLRTTSKTNLVILSPPASSKSPRPSSIAEILDPHSISALPEPQLPLSPPLSPPPQLSAVPTTTFDRLLEDRQSIISSSKQKAQSKLKRASRRLRDDCPLQIANRVKNLSRSLSRSSSQRSTIRKTHGRTGSDVSTQYRTVPGDPSKIIVPLLPSKPTKPTHQRNESAPVASTQILEEEVKKQKRRPWSTVSSITHAQKKNMISSPVSFKGSTLLHGFEDEGAGTPDRPLSIQEIPIIAIPKLSVDLQSRISSSSSSTTSETSSNSNREENESDSDSDDLIVPALGTSPGTSSPNFLQQTGLLLAFPSPPTSRPGTPAPRSPNLSMAFSRPSTPVIRVDTSSVPAPLRTRKVPGQGRSLSPVAESPDVLPEGFKVDTQITEALEEKSENENIQTQQIDESVAIPQARLEEEETKPQSDETPNDIPKPREKNQEIQTPNPTPKEEQPPKNEQIPRESTPTPTPTPIKAQPST